MRIAVLCSKTSVIIKTNIALYVFITSHLSNQISNHSDKRNKKRKERKDVLSKSEAFVKAQANVVCFITHQALHLQNHYVNTSKTSNKHVLAIFTCLCINNREHYAVKLKNTQLSMWLFDYKATATNTCCTK